MLQAGVIRLLKDFNNNLAHLLFITHNLRLVERFCQRVMVMDNGQIVETQVVGDNKLTFLPSDQTCTTKRGITAFPCAITPQEKV